MLRGAPANQNLHCRVLASVIAYLQRHQGSSKKRNCTTREELRKVQSDIGDFVVNRKSQLWVPGIRTDHQKLNLLRVTYRQINRLAVSAFRYDHVELVIRVNNQRIGCTNGRTAGCLDTNCPCKFFRHDQSSLSPVDYGR